MSETAAALIDSVKLALNVTGDYQDETIAQYIDEVVAFLTDAGVVASKITPGIVARGVSDLWQYGTTDGKLSSYFMQRATQLSYKK